VSACRSPGYGPGVEQPCRPGYEIRRYGASDWRQVRQLRLEMLADTPLAYVESLSDAQQYGEDLWQDRAASAEQPHQLGLAGVLPGAGRWIAHARGAAIDDRDGRAFVFSVYVAPDFRGRGVAGELFDRVERWAAAQGHPDLFLYVHEANARAIAFYRRRGYSFTGDSEPYALNPVQSELEMRLPLR
jgi:ribosomal protein S18 acetylase RimI-like enzyme